ncbi:MAG: hypothetical protein R3223_06985 [Longimicrobiales bacterium]|nr:hypothetical protein [Longimicrobiales bacterium]
MDLTDRARRDLDRYLERVRESLWDREEVDAEEVVDGIREHVEATLTSREGGPVTAEELADVLERLGSPEEWGKEETMPRVPTPPDAVLRGGAGTGPWIELVPLILAGAGGLLILVELTVPLGWGLLAVAAVTARLVMGSPTYPTVGSPVSAALVALLWHVSAIAAVGAILLAPAVLVWGQSQIGGALVPFLLEHTLPPGATSTPVPGTRPSGYWPLVGLLAGTATGAWWIAAGIAWKALGEGLRRILGPADYLASPAVLKAVLLAGGFLFVLSLVLLLGALG